MRGTRDSEGEHKRGVQQQRLHAARVFESIDRRAMKRYRVRGHKLVEVEMIVEAASNVEAIIKAGDLPASDWRTLENLRDTIEVIGSDLVKT